MPSTINVGCSAIYFAPTRTSWQGLQGFNSAVPILHYGVFSDTTTQTAAAINTAYAMTLNTTDASNGVSVGSPTSRIVVAQQGVYNIQFSTQLDKASGATGIIWIWLRHNGTNVPNTASKVAIQGTAAECVAAWNFVLELEANDYIELMWATDDTNVQLTAASSTALLPAIPSVILTVTQVNNL